MKGDYHEILSKTWLCAGGAGAGHSGLLRLRYQQKARRPAQVSYGNWLRDDADLLTDETEASLRQYDQSWDSNYRAIIAVATLDTLNGWTYEKAAAELGSGGGWAAMICCCCW